MVTLVRLSTQTITVTNKCGWLNTLQNQGSKKTSAYVFVQKTYVSPLTKSKGTRDKTFTMLGEVGMANESTKTTQTSVRMAQHNEQTRLA